ncbi:MAG: L,D-transpeptidase family protein [Chromatiales bacterium]|nr:L,D-transpeptidase family protein [Chromatiales bacterium]
MMPAGGLVRRLCLRLSHAAWLLAWPAIALALPADPDWHLRPADPEAVVEHQQYQLLVAAREFYAALAGQGDWPALPDRDLVPGQRDPAVRDLRRLLRATGDFSGWASADPEFFDGPLAESLLRFQRRHGLPLTARGDAPTRAVAAITPAQRVDQLDVAIERWRWLPRQFESRHIWVNIAAAQVNLVEDGAVVLSLPAVVGHPQRPTPSLRSEIRSVTFRPEWTVPRSLAVEDLLPLQQQDPRFLERQRIRVYRLERGGGRRPVQLSQVDWKRLGPDDFPYTLVQEAGPENSLGLVRFDMPNPFNVYLHDTPARGFFRLSARTLSAGCVRVDEPLRLADAVLMAGQPGWVPGTTAQRVGFPGREALAMPLPVYLVYMTAWVDAEGQVNFRPDIYRRDTAVLSELRTGHFAAGATAGS